MNPVKMTPGHQMILLHSSQPSQGHSSALFYGKPFNDSTQHNHAYTGGSMREKDEEGSSGKIQTKIA